MAVVERVEGAYPVIQGGVGQEEVVHLRPCQPPEALKGRKRVGEGFTRWGDQGKHPEVLLELSEDLPVRDPESGQNGEELSHSLLSDTGHDLPCLGLFPEGQAELVVIQGGSRGSEDKAGVVKDKLLHGPSRLYANPVKSSLGNGTAIRSKKRSAGGLIH